MTDIDDLPRLIVALVVAGFGFVVTLSWPSHRGKAFWPLGFLFFGLSELLPEFLAKLPNGFWPSRFWASWQVAEGVNSLLRAASVACLLVGALTFRPVEATLPAELRESGPDDSETGRSTDEA